MLIKINKLNMMSSEDTKVVHEYDNDYDGIKKLINDKNYDTIAKICPLFSLRGIRYAYQAAIHCADLTVVKIIIDTRKFALKEIDYVAIACLTYDNPHLDENFRSCTLDAYLNHGTDFTCKLLELGDIIRKDFFDYAFNTNNQEILDFAIEHANNEFLITNVLISSLRNNRCHETIKKLICKIDIQNLSENGLRILTWCSYDTFKYLIGLNVNFLTPEALMHAIQNENEDIADYLLQNNVKPRTKDLRKMFRTLINYSYNNNRSYDELVYYKLMFDALERNNIDLNNLIISNSPNPFLCKLEERGIVMSALIDFINMNS